MPLHKEPDWLWSTIEKWLLSCKDKLNESIPDLLRGLLEYKDLKEEAQWLRNRLESENSPVVFCHNDMQEGNILMRRDADVEGKEPEIVIIGNVFFSKIYID